MDKRLTVALVAHDAMKHDLAEWVAWNWEKLLSHRIMYRHDRAHRCRNTYGTPRTRIGKTRFDITMLKSGPLGGDQQLGSMIANNEIDMLIFFWDQCPHNPMMWM